MDKTDITTPVKGGEIMFEGIIGQNRAKLAMTDWYLHEKQPLLIYGSSGFRENFIRRGHGCTYN